MQTNGRQPAAFRAKLVRCLWAWLAAGIGMIDGPASAAAPGTKPGKPQRDVRKWDEPIRVVKAGRAAAGDASGKTPRPSDDWTFRPTVIIRQGRSQGSGTIIASVEGEALVLTAAHVVKETAPVSIELHRYNLGLERTHARPGMWPRSVEAVVVASDRAADLAVLRVDRVNRLPYVARLAIERPELGVNAVVTSVGVDLGHHLSSWSSRLVEAVWFELNDNREERLFFLTTRVPEHGRSGGGLFLPGGALVGVCIGHAELVRGRRQGVFASRESIHRLLVDHDLLRTIARSEVERSRPGRHPSRTGADAGAARGSIRPAAVAGRVGSARRSTATTEAGRQPE